MVRILRSVILKHVARRADNIAVTQVADLWVSITMLVVYFDKGEVPPLGLPVL
jgi:hypothetical protein